MSYDEREITRKFLRNIAGYEDEDDNSLLTATANLKTLLENIEGADVSGLPMQDVYPYVDVPDEPEQEVEEEGEVSWYNILLEIAGLIPGYGEAFDAINALDYLRKGMYLFAALSLISIIPVVGDAIGKGGKIAILLSKLGKTGKYIQKGARFASTNRQVFKRGASWGREFKTMLRNKEKDTDAVFAFVDETAENPELKNGIPKMKSALSNFAHSPDEDFTIDEPATVADVSDIEIYEPIELPGDEGPEEEALTERDITRDFLKTIY